MAIKQERTCALLPACSLLLFPFSKEIGDVCTQTSALARIGSHVRLCRLKGLDCILCSLPKLIRTIL